MSDDIRRRLRGNAPPFVGRPLGLSGQRNPSHHPGSITGCPPTMFPRSSINQPLLGGPCSGAHQQPRTPIPPPLTAGGATQAKFSFGVPPPSTPPAPNALTASAAGPIRRASSRPLMTARAPPVVAPQSSLHSAGRIGSKRRSIQLRLGSRPPLIDYSQIPPMSLSAGPHGPVTPSREMHYRLGMRRNPDLFLPLCVPPPPITARLSQPPPSKPPPLVATPPLAALPTPAPPPSPSMQQPSTSSTSSKNPGHALKASTPAIIECFQEYDIPQMEARADRFSEVEVLKKRAMRFEEEVASELVQPKVAEKKNIRFRRFMEEEDEDSDEITKLLDENQFSRMSLH